MTALEAAIEVATRIRDYDHPHPCRQCGKPDHIRVQHPASVVQVLYHWYNRMGGKCRACIEKGKAKA